MAGNKHDCGKRWSNQYNAHGKFVGKFCTRCRVWKGKSENEMLAPKYKRRFA